MSLMPQQQLGLRGRILITVGAITIFTMMFMSWGILYRWRQGQVHREEVNALAVGSAFSVAIIDAMAYAEQGFEQPEGVLDHYVDLFMNQNERLRAVAILDPRGEVIARNWGHGSDRWLAGNRITIVNVSRSMTVIDQLEDGTWVLEAILPMQSGAHRWGVLVLAFEADSIRDRVLQGFLLLFLFSASVILILMLLLWVMLTRILESLQVLVAAMSEVDFERGFVPELPRRADEIGLLHRGFYRMGKRLRQSRADLVHAQKQVWHAERLAAIGRFAAGLAHEINNPVNGVRNCIYAIRGEPDNKEQTEEYLEMMDEGMSLVSGVTTKLLAFARKQEPELAEVSLNEIAESVVHLARLQLDRRDIRIDAELAAGLPHLMADRQLLQEVILNLVLNAGDAVEDGGGIDIRTSQAGREVLLEVQDNGHGIPEELQDRIFEPFFTTKEPGEGTGLGLSISLGIVQAHCGSLEAASTPDLGTRFTVKLPAADNGTGEDES